MLGYDGYLDREYEDHCEAQRVADRALILRTIGELENNITEALGFIQSHQAELATGTLGLLDHNDTVGAIAYERDAVSKWRDQIADLEEELRFT